MRIAIISLHSSPAETPGVGDAGGMNVVVRKQGEALAAAGHEVHIFTRASERAAAGKIVFGSASQVVLHTLPIGAANLTKEALPAIASAFAEAVISHGRFDLIHSHYWLSALAGEKIAAASAAPHAITLHTLAAQKNENLAPGQTPEPQKRLEEEKRLVSENTVIATSFTELEAIEKFTRLSKTAYVLHPGVDTELFKPERASEKAHQLLVLGRLQPLKGADFAIRVLAALKKTLTRGEKLPRLIFAGQATPGSEGYVNGLKSLAHELGLSVSLGDIEFVGALTRSDAAVALAASKLLLHPSNSETFGLNALEAAACGTPVIATNTQGLRESVGAGLSGLLLERDEQEWAKATHSLLNDEEKLAALSKSARNFALAHSWQIHAEKLTKIYAELTR